MPAELEPQCTQNRTVQSMCPASTRVNLSFFQFFTLWRTIQDESDSRCFFKMFQAKLERLTFILGESQKTQQEIVMRLAHSGPWTVRVGWPTGAMGCESGLATGALDCENRMFLTIFTLVCLLLFLSVCLSVCLFWSQGLIEQAHVEFPK